MWPFIHALVLSFHFLCQILLYRSPLKEVGLCFCTWLYCWAFARVIHSFELHFFCQSNLCNMKS
ncbi:hypothetical protein BDV27DRAFT_98670 [Aspergillus caelatus]|uniref:Uncharacterized protein n=1 Tax=Aspergillus caelatus TaxID=61420 RepID=A0A5N7AB60_9EURO|nr:uncharacterized protein BDV27DRAFT_98670 [Aspergillus caelatus]KAE8365820.1 hypothetical protein BDV27DRAFT_98670 [Aspergillus caelatus]